MMDTAIDQLSNQAHVEGQELAEYRRLVEQLPLTLRPSLNQQLSEWEKLFPFEQGRIAGFMKGIGSLQPAALAALMAPLRALEARMGVKDWEFSETMDTMGNSSLLARSAYYAEWRSEVQKIFETATDAARDSSPALAAPTRLVLVFLPDSLPVDPLTAWKHWDSRGRQINISGDSRRFCELVIQGLPGLPGIATLLAQQGSLDSSDLWLIDAGARLGSMVSPASPVVPYSLSFEGLRSFRDRFLDELNTIPRNIQVTDQTLAALRREDWDQWWPPELAGKPKLRNFIIDLYLSGNGALNFSNAFAEWAAAEALRRARPRVIAVRFGVRSKPKPFTSIAIFENQQKISPLPDVDDPENSAIDAVILARYVWLAAGRYPEQEKTACVCVAEHGNSAYVIPPVGKNLSWSPERPVTPEELYNWLATQFLA